MTVPPPNYDLILLREHLYQDLRSPELVLPSNVDDTGFKPLHERGLGVFDYHLASSDEPSTDTYLYVIAAFCSLVIIYNMRYFIADRSRKMSQTLRRKSSNFINEHLYDIEAGSPELDATPEGLPSLSESPFTPMDYSPVYLRNSEVKLMEFDSKFGISRDKLR
ncbi:unnamed protein product [Kuraishia capsulata CBS 1993]|uniref:Uncharacterized protein n=1 Tax=Kuraishia capsulata CBS 1993 TaxID=1382522 RepID=W6MJ57_9ASCO|nr:uncharacterized protein KUCA_T00000420001 [Kuraishia capsulata CBS 1993]CDK24457.1 unnamed protein product [Kuraishia capsulata CBS 1993]